MNQSNKALQIVLFLLADLIILSVTLIVFFIGFGNAPRMPVDYAALTFVLISEGMLFIGAALSWQIKFHRIFFRSGTITILTLYWVAATLISIFHKLLFRQNINGLITTQSIVLAIALLALIGVFSFSARLKGIQERDVTQRDVLLDCENKIFDLKNARKLRNYAAALTELYQALKNSDRTVELAEPENEISGKIDDLCETAAASGQTGPDSSFGERVNEVLLLVRQRNHQVTEIKKRK